MLSTVDCRLSTALLLVLAAGCGKGPAEAPKARALPDYVPRAAAAAPDLPEVVLRDVTADSGLRFVHENGSFGKKLLPETMGSGAALLDYDGDGRLDIFLVNGMRWPGHDGDYRDRRPPATQALYRNLGGLRFEDVTAAAGVGETFMGMGAAVADIDDDGDPDLFVTGVGRNLLLRNDGGRFTERAVEAGLAAPSWTDGKGRSCGSWGTSAAFLDHDRDGRADLFVACYVRWSEETDIFTTLDGTHKAFTTPELYPGDTCRLYRNLGGGRFEDVTEKAGILGREAKALGVAIEDVDDDGREDILVANDTQPNNLYLNRGDGTFAEAGLSAGIAYSPEGRARAGMGIDAIREPGSGCLLIGIGNFSREPVALFRTVSPLFFQDGAAAAGIGPATLLSLTFGVLFADYDLDGLPDLLIANGHIEPSIGEVQKEIRYAQAPQLFRALGGCRYREVSRGPGGGEIPGGFLGRPAVARGLAAGDLDGDGDLDFIVTENGGPARIIRCDSAAGSRSVRLRLRGAGTNLDALGARVRLKAGGRMQERRVRSGSSYLSESERTLTFGIGTAAAAESVEVTWPDGSVETFREVAGGRTWVLVKGAGKLDG